MLALLVCTSLTTADDQKPADMPAAEKVTFDDHVLPIFRAKCGSCHNANDRKGNLVLDDYTALREGGGSGEVVEAGDLEASYLWSLVTHESTPEMPPNQPKLPDAELALIQQWILGGLLKDKGSKAEVKKKAAIAKIDVSGERPAGPPPMPAAYLGEPITVAPRANSVTALAVSPWAPLVAVSGHKQISLFDTRSRTLLGVLPFPEGQPEILKFSRNASLLLAGGGRGGASGKVVVFDVVTGARKVEVGNEYDTVLGADISPDHTLIALGGPKRMVRVYSTATGEQLYEKKKHTDWVTTAAFSPDGVLLATGDRANGLVIWEAQTGNEYLILNGHSNSVTDVAWRPDSNSLASASLDGTVRLWELNDGREIKKWDAHGGGATAIDYVHDGRIVTVGKDRTAKLWQGDGAGIRTFEGLSEMGLEVGYDADTDVVLAGDVTGRVIVWKGADGAVQGELSTNPPTLAQQIAAVRDQLTAAQAQTQAAVAQLATVKQQADKLLADRKALADTAAAAAMAMVAQVEKTTTAKVAVDTKVAEEGTKAQQAAAKVQQAEATVKALEEQLAAAKIALQQAQAEKQAVDKVLADSQALAAQTVKSLAEMQAKVKPLQEAAAAAAAAVVLTPEEQKPLADAQAAQAAAQAQVEGLQKRLAELESLTATAAAK